VVAFGYFIMDLSLSEECAICNKPIGTSPKATLGEKGCVSINKASEEKNQTVHCVPGQLVHQECRRKYCKPNQTFQTIKQKEDESMTGKITLRSAQREFNFSTDCFFCGKSALVAKKRKSSEVVPVRTV